jgi:MFS superfamily sulfate permease-like transporter
MIVTLMTDLLVGVGVGLLLKIVLHLKHGAPFGSLFKTIIHERREGDTLVLEVRDAAIFTNYLGLNKRLKALEPDVRRVIIDFKGTWVVDHTVLEKLHDIGDRWSDRELVIAGLDDHRPMSKHRLAARRRVQEGSPA